MPTDPVVRPAVWSTVAFAVASAVAVASNDGAGIVAIFDLVLFALGCLVFARTLLTAAQRSRTEELSVAGIWLLAGQRKDIQRWLLGCLAAQVVIALAAAGLRPYTAVAFGVLVPTLGLALCGLWAVRSGTFPPRASGTTD
ncbi:MAG: hypothetical protein V7636_459 [Actinomycetota bacterium]